MDFDRNCDLVGLLGGFESAIRFVCNWNDLSISLLVEDGGSFRGDLSFTQNNANMLELYKEFLGSAAGDIQVMSNNSPTFTGLHHHGKLGFKLRIRDSPANLKFLLQYWVEYSVCLQGLKELLVEFEHVCVVLGKAEIPTKGTTIFNKKGDGEIVPV